MADRSIQCDIQGRTVVVTGASSGIGEALAREAAARGARVWLAARSAERLEAIAGELRAGGAEAFAAKTDVRRRAEVTALARRAADPNGIDVWINNAGVSSNLPILEMTAKEVDFMMRVNLKGALYGSQAALRYMLPRKAGRIVNVSSIAAKIPFGVSGAYVMAKCALNGLTAQLRLELRGTGVTVVCAMPGRTLTNIGANASNPGPEIDVEAAAEAYLSEAPVSPEVSALFDKLMTPQSAGDCAKAILDSLDGDEPEFYPNPVHRVIPELLMKNLKTTQLASAPIVWAIYRQLEAERMKGDVQ